MASNTKLKAVVAVLLVAGLLAGIFYKNRSDANIRYSENLFAMDTIMTFTAYGKNAEKAVHTAVEEVKRLDALLSAGNPESEIGAVNANGGGTLSLDARENLVRALEISESTDGLFDPTIRPLMELWGFTTQEYHVPSEAELSDALSLVDASKVVLDGDTVTLGAGQKIDLGGIAKGYTSAKVMEIFQSYKVKSGMVSLGGNIQALGAKPDHTLWRVGIRDPKDETGLLLAAVVEVENRAVITSGGYERYFEEDGNTYIHILDPRTGKPADNGLLSVTIVSADGTLADALSTSLYIMGREKAADYWRAHAELFDMILVTDDCVYVSSGIPANRIEISEDYKTVRLEP